LGRGRLAPGAARGRSDGDGADSSGNARGAVRSPILPAPCRRNLRAEPGACMGGCVIPSDDESRSTGSKEPASTESASSARGNGGGSRSVSELAPTVRIRGRAREEVRAENAQWGLGLSFEEWQHLIGRLGRDPLLPEAFLLDVSLSEHCSYKSSRPFLRRHIPPLASHVVLGP